MLAKMEMREGSIGRRREEDSCSSEQKLDQRQGWLERARELTNMWLWQPKVSALAAVWGAELSPGTAAALEGREIVRGERVSKQGRDRPMDCVGFQLSSHFPSQPETATQQQWMAYIIHCHTEQVES